MLAFWPAAYRVALPDPTVLPQFNIGAAAAQAVLASAAKVREGAGVPDGAWRAYFVLVGYLFCLWWD